MDSTAIQKAVKLAIDCNWKEAINQNLDILKKNPQDINTLNRLAKAYFEFGNIKKACETTKKALSIDSSNIIAQKSLNKWKDIKNGQIKHNKISMVIDTFIEDPGKTKLISLINLGSKNILNELNSGDVVCISCHAHKVSIVTKENKYIGKLPDDISLRIRNLHKKGFEYLILIKSISNHNATIFIREIKRPQNIDIISFPIEKIEYISYTSPDLIHQNKAVLDNVELISFSE